MVGIKSGRETPDPWDFVRYQRTWTVTNHNEDSTINCDSTSDGELADVLCTLIKDMIGAGLLKGTVS